MSTTRRSLFERLPEIYRIRDGEQTPPGQFEAFLDVLDTVFAGLDANNEALYHDLFVETCADWVVLYIADLLGSSHLSGAPWTLRADTARTVHHRRRKGTLGAIESLSYSLTGWAAHALELRNTLVWNQHLNHQRPDIGGAPPLTAVPHRASPARGGTVNLRDPATLSLLNGPFDPFAHIADVKPVGIGPIRHNLPNLGVFLWRLKDYQVPVIGAGLAVDVAIAGANVAGGEAAAALRVIAHPQADPMTLFNRHRFAADAEPPELSELDAVPGPMPPARLTSDSIAGAPVSYIDVDHHGGAAQAPGPNAPGLVIHIPAALIAPPVNGWTFRGANLCAWESGLSAPLRDREIVVDPRLGRILIGLADRAGEAAPLADQILLSYTYGFAGPTGAHPSARADTPAEWLGSAPTVIRINHASGANPLEAALANLHTRNSPLVIEIEDSRRYRLDLGSVNGALNDGGNLALRPAQPVWIRALSGQRPVVELTEPLRIRPADVTGPNAPQQMAGLEFRLEGLYLTPDRNSAAFGGDEALIERAAVNRLSVVECTLDPGGAWQLDGTELGTRQVARPALRLGNDYGFANAAEETAFDQTPELVFERSILGRAFVDDGYRLHLEDSILDAASDAPGAWALAATGATPQTDWGAPLTFSGVTCFGRVRTGSVDGSGGIWTERLEAHDNQIGCVRLSYLSGDADRLPPNFGCVFGPDVDLGFTARRFGRAGYAQLSLRSDRRVLSQGPDFDAMGAFGYLLNDHKWKNLQIRFREYVPVGIATNVIPVT